MPTNRANLDNDNQAGTYLVLTFVMLLLSAIGLYLYLHLPQPTTADISTPTPQVTDIPTSELIPSTIDDLQPTSIPTVVPTPTTNFYSSDSDKFSVVYKSYRTIYPDKEYSGNRYTLYSASGNIAIHVGKTWSWTYPSREFTDTVKVAGQPTFVYDVPSQTITDFQFGGLNYTIQCVHNGKEDLKSECQQLLSDFKLL